MSTLNGPTLLLADERRRVAEACRLLSRSGLVVGTAGNVSVRVDSGLLITPTGVEWMTKNLPRSIADIETFMAASK